MREFRTGSGTASRFNEAERNPDMTSLKGNLNSVDLANIFQMLTLNQREGTLYIFEGASRKAIYFGLGGASMLTKGKAKTDALGRILLRYDRVTPEQLDHAIRRKQESGRMLGQVLVEESMCSRTDIDEALQIQIQEEVYSLFIWKDAQFEFVEGEPDEEFNSEGAQKLSFSVNSVIMEAARRVDEWGWIQGVVPDTSEVYRYTSRNVPLTDSIFQEAFAGKVLAAIDGRRSGDEVIAASYVNRFEVCKILAILSDAGAIEKLPVPELRREAEAAVTAGDTAAAVKFLSRLVAVKGDTPDMHERLAKAFEREHELESAARHYRVFGEIRAGEGRTQEAYEIHRHVVELLPTDLAAADRMIELFAAEPEGLEARTAEIVARGKDLAEIYLELKRAPRAIQVLHRIVTLAPDDQDVRSRLIAVYVAANMNNEAIAEYESLAETALAVDDLVAAEKIFRKIVAIDRQRVDVVARLDQVLSKKRRRQRNLRNLTVAGGAAVVLAVAGWFGLAWYREMRDTERQRDADSIKRLDALRAEALPVRADLDALVKELTVRPGDMVQLAVSLRTRLPDVEAAATRTQTAVRSLASFRAEFQGLTADEDAMTLSNELSGRLASVKRTVSDIQRSLKENAETSFAQSQQMLSRGESTRGALQKAEFAVRLTQDGSDWLTTEDGQKCAELHRQLQEYIAKFETTRAAVEQKIADNDIDGAFETAVGYLTDHDFPPLDLRTEMPVPVRISSRPAGARILTKEGVDTGLVAGPACVVKISALKGASFDLELPGFKKTPLSIAPVTELVPAAVREKLQRNHDVLLEKSQVFRKATSDGRAVTAAPFASARYAVIPSSRACDVVDLSRHEIVSTLSLNGDRSVRACGLVVPQGADEVVVVPTGDGALMFFDAATGKSRGSWTEARGALVFDLALAGDDVIAADDRGNVYCIGIETRQKRWSFVAFAASGELTNIASAPVVSGAEVYVGCEDGSVQVLDVVAGRKLRTLTPPSASTGRISAPVALSSGAVYAVNRDGSKQTRVSRWNAATGRSDWSVLVAGEVKSAPMPHDGTVFVVTTAGEVHGLKALDGEKSHSGAADRAVKVPGEATMAGGVIYVGCDNGMLYALDVHGPEVEPLWRFPVRTGAGKPIAVTTRSVLAGGLILFGAADGAMYALGAGN